MSIEELAFKDRKILANLNAVDLLNIIEFLQDDRRQCLEELSKTHNRSVEIQKENQELKSQLAGTTHCFDEEEHNKLKEENQELKEKFKATNKGLQKAVLKRKKWKYRYQLARCEIKELKEKLDKYENPEDMTLFVMWCTEKVKDENEKLKKHLKVPKACNLKTLEDYKSYYEDTTREQILEDTYIEYCAYVNLAHRYSELKEQLENCYCNRTDCSGRIKDSKKYDSLVQAQEAQQKEFIKYLEDEIKKQKEDIFANSLTAEDIDLYIKRIKLLKMEEILQKYKETIGVSDEKTN